MTDISFLKAVVKWRQDEKHKMWYTYLLQTQPIKTVPHCGGKKKKKQLVVSMWSDKASYQ